MSRGRGQEWGLRAMLLVVAVIHLLPVSGVLGADALTRLYGLDFSAPDLALLMRHRAVLFGLLGLLLLAAMFRPALRGLALLAGYASLLSFLALAWAAGDVGPALQRVVRADLLALLCLVIATAIHFWRRGEAGGRG